MKKLEKNISFWGVFAISTGTIISGGFFLLPGFAAMEAGSSMILAYIIAAIPLIPVIFSQIELATAIPKAGGIYFFIDRTLGPYFGTIGGIGTWLAFILKSSFALIGMGAYLKIFFPDITILPVALFVVVFLGVINLFGSKKSSIFQVVLFLFLILILLFFIVTGLPQIDKNNLQDIGNIAIPDLLSTSGFVFMSYIGITKVISLAEEIKNPEKNLTKGVFWSLGISLAVYILGLIIMIGVVPMEELAGSMIPVARAAEISSGSIGVVLISIAALLSFLSVANAGILSSSRFPLAMSRDHLMPRYMRKINEKGTPYIAIILTVMSIILILIFLDPGMIAKLASTFLLLIFSIVCFSVIVMRESKIEAYDPGYHSPLYPWMQIFGIVSSFILIIEMGLLPFLFSFGLIILGSLWYFYYVKKNVLRTGAIYNIFERLGKYKYAGIDYELREMMKKKGLRREDPFDEVIAKSKVLDIEGTAEFEDLVSQVSEWIANDVNYSAKSLEKEFMDGTRIGATPVIHDVALPHLILDGLKNPQMVLVRSNHGVRILYSKGAQKGDSETEVIVKAVFFLISPKNNPSQHLRILARIAGRVEETSFLRDWNNAKNEHELKISLLHFERLLFLKISKRDETFSMANKRIREIWLSEGSLVVWIKRSDQYLIPDGETVIMENDILTIIGEPENLDEIVKHYKIIRINYYE